jgi:hypothetical protein
MLRIQITRFQSDPFEQCRKNKSQANIQRIRERDEERKIKKKHFVDYFIIV